MGICLVADITLEACYYYLHYSTLQPSFSFSVLRCVQKATATISIFMSANNLLRQFSDSTDKLIPFSEGNYSF
ncbi:MAG TPA: hypothetical protein DFH96_02230 [Bacteroidetes bacterium]|nr:hypothetical protein [Bacteroidota bacterium]